MNRNSSSSILNAALANNLRYYRLKHNLSQEDIAKILGYKSFTTIQKWESGVSEPPIAVVYKLAIVFGIRMEDFFK